jgi:hypothetical protein
MGRKGAASPPVLTRNASHLPFPASLRWPFGIKRTALVAVVLVLLGTVTIALLRELGTTARVDAPAISKPARPPKAAFTPAEEAYIQALWPIHGDVERSTARMTLGQIFYKTNDMDRPSLKKRVDDALATYRRSDARLRALQPPASVERDHQEYLSAVALFQQSAIEVLRMFEDGRDDHLVAAYPLSQKASDKIREVGGKFWPNEFAPN